MVYRILLAGLAVSLFTIGGSALAAKNAGPHKAHGKVLAVVVNKDGTGSITIETHKHKKGSTTAEGETVEKTFEVTAVTQFTAETKAGGKAASLADVQKGEHVSIEHDAKSRVASSVEIGHHGKKGKKGAVAVAPPGVLPTIPVTPVAPVAVATR